MWDGNMEVYEGGLFSEQRGELYHLLEQDKLLADILSTASALSRATGIKTGEGPRLTARGDPTQASHPNSIARQDQSEKMEQRRQVHLPSLRLRPKA